MKRLSIGLSALVLLMGHLLPWAAHRTAPLTLSANDLGFFTNFTPGAGIFWNEWFYLPVWVAAWAIEAVSSPIVITRESPADNVAGFSHRLAGLAALRATHQVCAHADAGTARIRLYKATGYNVMGHGTRHSDRRKTD